MKMSAEHAAEEMNWVDYCDSLSNEFFVNPRPRQKPPSGPETVPDQAAFVACLQDIGREVK